jgi:hypothetical protein
MHRQTISMDWNPSSETDSHSADEELFRVLRYLKINCPVHKSPPFVQMNV